MGKRVKSPALHLQSDSYKLSSDNESMPNFNWVLGKQIEWFINNPLASTMDSLVVGWNTKKKKPTPIQRFFAERFPLLNETKNVSVGSLHCILSEEIKSILQLQQFNRWWVSGAHKYITFNTRNWITVTSIDFVFRVTDPLKVLRNVQLCCSLSSKPYIIVNI